MKFKSFLTAVALAVASVASACWFTADNYNRGYIDGVNNYIVHYDRLSTSFNNATYNNGQTVSSPITVFVQVNPKKSPQGGGDPPDFYQIKKAILQYKILPNGGWITVRTIQNVHWPLDWPYPVALFGHECIDLPNLPAGTEILIRLYLTDNRSETGNLNVDITGSQVPNTENTTNWRNYRSAWPPPYVMKVILSGKERPKWLR